MRKTKEKKTSQPNGENRFRRAQPAKRLSARISARSGREPSGDPHAAGDPAGGAEFGGLAGSNIGDGSPVEV